MRRGSGKFLKKSFSVPATSWTVKSSVSITVLVECQNEFPDLVDISAHAVNSLLLQTKRLNEL